MIKLVIFDFDDTLSMTEELGFVLENYVAGKMGFKPMKRSLHKKTWGMPIKDAAEIRFPGIDVGIFTKKNIKMRQEFAAKGKFDVVPKNNLKVLKSLKAKGLHLAMLTSRTKEECSNLISKKNELSLYFRGSLYFREKTHYGKPDPRVFNELLNKEGFKASESVYVGDSPSDAVCAKLAGLAFIANLESDLRKPKDFIKGTVDTYIKKLTDVESAIFKVNKKTPLSVQEISNKEVKFVLTVAGERISVPHDYFFQKLPEVKVIVEDILRRKNKK